MGEKSGGEIVSTRIEEVFDLSCSQTLSHWRGFNTRSDFEMKMTAPWTCRTRASAPVTPI